MRCLVSAFCPVRELGIADEFFDSTATTTKDLTLWIPESEGQHLVLGGILRLTVFAFCVFGAAMFAEPTVANIEKVIGLIQGKGLSANSAGLKSSDRHFIRALLPAQWSASHVRSLSELDGNRRAPAIPKNANLYRITNLVLIEDSEKVISISDFLTVE